MRDGLLEINEVTGVAGSLLCSNQGEIFESGVLPPELDQNTLDNICQQAIELLGVTQTSLPEMREYVLYFSGKKIFIQDLERVILVVFCDASVDITLLRMSINIVNLRWSSDSIINMKFAKFANDRVIPRKIAPHK